MLLLKIFLALLNLVCYMDAIQNFSLNLPNIENDTDVLKGRNNKDLSVENEIKDEKMNKQKLIKGPRKPVKLNMKQGLTMNQILGVYSLTEVPNDLCRNHSIEFNNALRAFEPWALKMFDSSSKLQSGILMGNLVEFGNFEQCLEIYENSQYGPIRGKHCLIKIEPGLKLIKKILSYRNISEKRFEKVHIFVQNASLDWSICVPDSCQVNDILKHIRKIVYSLSEGLEINVSLDEQDCYTRLDNKPFSNIELGVIIGFILFVLLILVCTIVDIYSTKEEASSNKMVIIFSAWRNSQQIFSWNKPDSNLDCVHGIRFLSTCYVIIGHRYLMMMFFPVVNSLQIMNWVLFYRSTVITGGTLCVDTFFMISGMLVSVGYFSEMEKRGKISWPMFYLYRYLRITPPLAVVVLWYSTIIQRFGSGPLWEDMLSTIQKPCQEYWWATLLHIQNYVNPYPLCMTQAWYLTCDMQYYFFSPILLIAFNKGFVVGSIVYTIIYIVSIAVGFYLAWVNEYGGGVPITNQLFETHYFQYHYITPHTRASTYIIGIGLGYAIHRTKDIKIEIPYPTIILGWLTCFVTMLASLVGCHVFHTEEHDYNKLESSIFISISRSAWTFGILWMVWACINGYGGPINIVLSHKLFRILGKISYGMYLLHMQMQYLLSGAKKQAGYFSDFDAWYAALSDLVIMVLIGFLFTVCFESPLVKFLSICFLGGKAERKVVPKIIQVKQEKLMARKEKLFTVS